MAVMHLVSGSNTNDFDPAPIVPNRPLWDGREYQRSDIDMMPSVFEPHRSAIFPLAGRLALGHDYGTRRIAHDVI